MICVHYAMLCQPSFNTVSLHSTAFNHCTVRYSTGRVGRYGQLYTYLDIPTISEPEILYTLPRLGRVILIKICKALVFIVLI